jgi:hypothetical protein
VLARRKVINVSDRPIARILGRILAKPFAGWKSSSRGVDALRDIRAAFAECAK